MLGAPKVVRPASCARRGLAAIACCAIEFENDQPTVDDADDRQGPYQGRHAEQSHARPADCADGGTANPIRMATGSTALS